MKLLDDGKNQFYCTEPDSLICYPNCYTISLETLTLGSYANVLPLYSPGVGRKQRGHFAHRAHMNQEEQWRELERRPLVVCVHTCLLGEGGGIDVEAGTDQWLEVTGNLIHSNE